MMVQKRLVVKMLAAGALLVGMVQATPVTLTELWSYQGNTSWQDIEAVSCSYVDVDYDNILEVGEQVTFAVTMSKNHWGTHNYDACLVWVDKLPGIEAPYFSTNSYTWDYNANLGTNYTNSAYSWADWTGKDTVLYKTVTFLESGDFGFAASVMCSADLSNLNWVGTWDNPVAEDWNTWASNPTIHKDQPWLQGEDVAYKLTVKTQNVPEPTLISLLGCGLLGLVFIRRKK